jgi:hypothetical protein
VHTRTLLQLARHLSTSESNAGVNSPCIAGTSAPRAMALLKYDSPALLKLTLLRALSNTPKVRLTALNVSSTAAKLAVWLLVRTPLLLLCRCNMRSMCQPCVRLATAMHPKKSTGRQAVL